MSFIDNLLRWTRVIKPKTETDDLTQFYVQQVEYMGKSADSLMIFPYGTHANVPADAIGIMFAIQGNPDNRGTIAWTPFNRPDLKGGEVAFYHPPTGAFIIWRESGNLEIETGNGGSGDITVTGGKVSVTADDVSITSPLTTITGALTVTGSTTLGSTVTSNGVNIGESHTHPQDNDSGGSEEFDTGGPQ